MHSSRRSHRKSRGGCANCKRRKIKCDEEKPVCGNCIKHSIECDFSTRLASHSSQHSPAPNIPPTPMLETNSTTDSNEKRASSQESGIGLNMSDLELLHNYTTSTALTLAYSNDLKTLWRINVPQLGFSHSYVMRAILAISALHMAHCKPAMREYYQAQAVIHRDISLRTAFPFLSSPNKDNCTPLYIVTALTFMNTLAGEVNPDDVLLNPEQGATSWISMLRGIRGIIIPFWDWLEIGPLGPLFRLSAQKVRSLDNQPPDDFLPELRRLILDPKILSAGELRVYEEAIDFLNPMFLMIHNSQGYQEYSEVLSFVARLDDEFFTYLYDRKPQALVILAYYCVLMKHMNHYWWVGNWGSSLLSRIYELLDVEHRLWIQWPIEETGIIP